MNSICGQNRISFTSRNHPIPTHVFHSARGDIKISEAKPDEIEEVTRFARKTALNFHKWLADQRGPSHLQEQEEKIKNDIEYLREIMAQADGNASVLVARNKRNQVVGTATMKAFPISVDSKVGELFKFYIAKPFRKIGLGKEINETLLDTVKAHYTDVFVSAANESVDFYKKLGYKTSDKTNFYRSDMERFLQKVRGENLCIVHSLNIDPKNTVEKRLEAMFGVRGN